MSPLTSSKQFQVFRQKKMGAKVEQLLSYNSVLFVFCHDLLPLDAHGYFLAHLSHRLKVSFCDCRLSIILPMVFPFLLFSAILIYR